jgi:hypothetical protein
MGTMADLRFGVLDFSYAGFTHFASRLAVEGCYDVNLGDYIQSRAVREALLAIGVAEDQIVYVDRDDLSTYAGEPVLLVMNGVFYPRCFPLSPHIVPVWFGFSFSDANLLPGESTADYRDALARLEVRYPVGCRDVATMRALQAAGHPAYLSGCLSSTLRPVPADRTYRRGLVCGLDDEHLASALAAEGLISLPDQRWVVGEHPLGTAARAACRRAAGALLAFYADHAGYVVTSLMHCALPCAAMGIPTVVVRRDPNNYRFDMVHALLAVHDASHAWDTAGLWRQARTIDVRDLVLPALRDAVDMAVRTHGQV